jgi:hypothetical protein
VWCAGQVCFLAHAVQRGLRRLGLVAGRLDRALGGIEQRPRLCHRKPRLVAGQAEIELLLPLVSLACRTAAYSEPQRGILQAAGDALRAIYDRRQIEQKDHRPRQCCGRLI